MDDLEERIRKRLTEVDRELRNEEGHAIGHSPYLPPHFTAGQRRVLATVLAEMTMMVELASLAARAPEQPEEQPADESVEVREPRA